MSSQRSVRSCIMIWKFVFSCSYRRETLCIWQVTDLPADEGYPLPTATGDQLSNSRRKRKSRGIVLKLKSLSVGVGEGEEEIIYPFDVHQRHVLKCVIVSNRHPSRQEALHNANELAPPCSKVFGGSLKIHAVQKRLPCAGQGIDGVLQAGAPQDVSTSGRIIHLIFEIYTSVASVQQRILQHSIFDVDIKYRRYLSHKSEAYKTYTP